MSNFRAPVANVIMATVLATCGCPTGANASDVYVYEDQIIVGSVYFFDIDRGLSFVGRRDRQSMSQGDPDTFSACSFGRVCIQFAGEPAPIVVADSNTDSQEGDIKIRTTDVTIGYSAPCLETTVYYTNKAFSKSIYCEGLGIVAMEMRGRYEQFDLVLKSYRGIGAE